MTIFGITPDTTSIPPYGVSTTTTSNNTATIPSGLDEAGNVPLVKPQDKPIAGVKLERTAQADSAATKPDEPKSQTPEPPKTGESIEERLTRYYSEYKTATPERKRELLEDYLKKSYFENKGLTREQQIKLQIADYKKLLYNTRKGPEYDALVEKIHLLEGQNQLIGARAATVGQKIDRLRHIGEVAIARVTHLTNAENQIPITEITAHSQNPEAMQEGASHVSELAKENQVKGVSLYENATINSNDPTEVKKFKTGIDKILINQYGNYAQENQLAIHKIMSSSQYSETIQYAAKNIGQFQDKNIREEAYQITVNTGNQEAIRYGQEAVEAADNGDDSQDSSCPDDSDAPNCEKGAQDRVKEESQNNLNTIDAVEDFSEALSSAKNSITQGEIIKNTSNTVKIFLAQTTSSVSVLAALLSNAPSRELFNAALDNLSSLPDDPDKRALILSLHQGGELTEDMMKNNPGLQLTVMRSTNNIQGIKREYLSVLGKYWFDKIKGEQQQKSGSVA